MHTDAMTQENFSKIYALFRMTDHLLYLPVKMKMAH